MNNQPYGVVSLTELDHYIVRWWSGDGDIVCLQLTTVHPSVDMNGVVSFPDPIVEVSKSFFEAEFRECSKEEFLEFYPGVADLWKELKEEGYGSAID